MSHPDHSPPCIDCRVVQDGHALLNESEMLSTEQEGQKLLCEIHEVKMLYWPMGIDCSSREACLAGLFCEHHLEMWRLDWFPPHADAVGAGPRLAEDNPAKRPRTAQHGGRRFCATSSDEDDDEPVEMMPWPATKTELRSGPSTYTCGRCISSPTGC